MKEQSIRPEIIYLLNLQYKTERFNTSHTFNQLLQTCIQALQEALPQVKYSLSIETIIRYSISLKKFEKQPFSQSQMNKLQKYLKICETLMATDLQYSAYLNSLNQLQICIQKEGTKVVLKEQFVCFYPNFRHINIIQALIFTSLSKCKMFFTMRRERKKSSKQFHLDLVINTFNNIVSKTEIVNPIHESILPRKSLKNIEKKVNSIKKDNALFRAVKEQKYEQVKRLILEGHDLQRYGIAQELRTNIKRDLKCSHQACLLGNLKMCQLLNSYGVDWEAEDTEKMSPIFHAIDRNSLEVVKYLVEQIKVNIEKEQIQLRTPFYFACTQGDMPMIKYLYSKGANINKKSILGRNSLSKACYLGRLDVVQFLMSCKEIDLHSQDQKGRTALHNATFGPKGGREGHKFGTNSADSPDCTQYLLENKFEIDKADFEDNTSLHIAMSSEALDSIRILISYGASMQLKNNYGETPLLTGAKFGHLQACKLLYEQYHADMTAIDGFGKNILTLTAKFQQENCKGHLQINPVFIYFVKEFIKKGNIRQIQQTLHQLFKNVQFNVQEEIIIIFDNLLENKIEFPKLAASNIQVLLQFDFSKYQTTIRKVIGLTDCLSKLNQKESYLILEKAATHNKINALEFIKQNEKEFLHPMGTMVETGQMVDWIPLMKEKTLTYFLLAFSVNWNKWTHPELKSNLIHHLVKHKKTGTLIQISKFFLNVNHPFLDNCHLKSLTKQQRLQLEQSLLNQQNKDLLNPYQLAQVLKDSAISKILQGKTNSIEGKNHWEIKEYFVECEKGEEKLRIFQQYELAYLLQVFTQHIKNEQWIFNNHPLFQKQFKDFYKGEAIEKIWQKASLRKLYFINSLKDLQLLYKWKSNKLFGIDIQYVHQDNTLIICLLQISTLEEDFIIDLLSSSCNGTYQQFVQELTKHLREIFHNPGICKIMHGSDHDLYLLKSTFNLSLINFIDTARADLEHTKKTELRSLTTLCKQYLSVSMSKDFQVSQWKIRPLPQAMLDYARRDSLILPYLAGGILGQCQKSQISAIFLGSAQQAKKNRKAHQPLIKKIYCKE